jgi:hypothetical protein
MTVLAYSGGGGTLAPEQQPGNPDSLKALLNCYLTAIAHGSKEPLLDGAVYFNQSFNPRNAMDPFFMRRTLLRFNDWIKAETGGFDLERINGGALEHVSPNHLDAGLFNKAIEPLQLTDAQLEELRAFAKAETVVESPTAEQPLHVAKVAPVASSRPELAQLEAALTPIGPAREVDAPVGPMYDPDIESAAPSAGEQFAAEGSPNVEPAAAAEMIEPEAGKVSLAAAGHSEGIDLSGHADQSQMLTDAGRQIADTAKDECRKIEQLPDIGLLSQGHDARS